jgi:hypothetical protein
VGRRCGDSTGGTWNLAHGEALEAGLIDSEAWDAALCGGARIASIRRVARLRLITTTGVVIEIEQPRQDKLRLEVKAWRTADVTDVVCQLWSGRG